MTSTVAPSTTRIFDGLTEKSKTRVTQVYRTKKSFAVVRFEPTGKGRIVVLPEGAEVRIVGPSQIGKCFEVMFDDQLYNMFRVDLLGPWATQIKPIPGLRAVAACA
jgi:hypothetical protein